MSTSYESFITILQLLGMVAVIISVSILIFKAIAYRADADKRISLMQGSTRLIIGIIIISSMTVIIGAMLNYISGVGIQGVTSSMGKPADISSMFKNVKGASGGSSILSDLVGAFLSVIYKGLNGLFDLKSINDLVFPSTVTVFNSAQWNAIGGLYFIMMFPATIFLTIMVWATGFKYTLSSINPKNGEEARASLYGWAKVILLIVGGFWLCKLVVSAGNMLDTGLITGVKSYMPAIPLGSNIDLGNNLFTGIAQLYMFYITLKVTVLYIIRDFMLAAFIIFTPIAAAMYGINKNVNAISIWGGELLSNSLMAFFMTFSFTVLGVLINVTLNTSNHPKVGYELIFLWVGLGATLKLASVLRNSVQSLVTRLSGMDEDGLANRSSLGGMVAGAMGMKRTYKQAGILKNDIKATKDNLFNAGERISTKAKNKVSRGGDRVGDTIKGAKTGAGAEAKSPLGKAFNTLKGTAQGAMKHGGLKGSKDMSADTQDLSIGANGNNATETGLNKNGIKNMMIDDIKNNNAALRGVKDQKLKEKFRAKQGEDSYNKMLGNIRNNYSDDVKSQMPSNMSQASRERWLNNKAENDLATSLGFQKPHASTKDDEGKEYFESNRNMIKDNTVKESLDKAISSNNVKLEEERKAPQGAGNFSQAAAAYKKGNSTRMKGKITRDSLVSKASDKANEFGE